MSAEQCVCVPLPMFPAGAVASGSAHPPSRSLVHAHCSCAACRIRAASASQRRLTHTLLYQSTPPAPGTRPRPPALPLAAVLPGVTYSALEQRASQAMRDSRRVGWYLQQFIKLGVALHLPALSSQYLVWDADVIALSGVELQNATHTRLCSGRVDARSAAVGGAQSPHQFYTLLTGLQWKVRYYCVAPLVLPPTQPGANAARPKWRAAVCCAVLYTASRGWSQQPSGCAGPRVAAACCAACAHRAGMLTRAHPTRLLAGWLPACGARPHPSTAARPAVRCPLVSPHHPRGKASSPTTRAATCYWTRLW